MAIVTDLARLGAALTVIDGLAAGAVCTRDLIDAEIELAHDAAVVLADGRCLVVVGVGELAVRIITTAVVAQIVAGAALLAGRDAAARISPSAVGMQRTSVTA